MKQSFFVYLIFGRFRQVNNFETIRTLRWHCHQHGQSVSVVRAEQAVIWGTTKRRNTGSMDKIMRNNVQHSCLFDPDARRKTLGSDIGALRSDADSFDAADARLAESRILDAEDSVSAGHAARHGRRRNVGAPLLERRLAGRQGHRIGRH